MLFITTYRKSCTYRLMCSNDLLCHFGSLLIISAYEWPPPKKTESLDESPPTWSCLAATFGWPVQGRVPSRAATLQWYTAQYVLLDCVQRDNPSDHHGLVNGDEGWDFPDIPTQICLGRAKELS